MRDPTGTDASAFVPRRVNKSFGGTTMTKREAIRILKHRLLIDHNRKHIYIPMLIGFSEETKEAIKVLESKGYELR